MERQTLEGLAQALFEESQDALFLFDPDSGQLLDVNSVGQRLTGFPLRELLAFTVQDLFHSGPETKDRPPLLEAARKTGLQLSKADFLLRTISVGVQVPIQLHVSRLHVKPKALGLVSARDIRDENEAKAASKEAVAELRRMLSALSDCVWSGLIDSEGRCVFRYFSPAVAKITGHPPEYFLEGIHRWWAVIFADDQARWAKAQIRLRQGEALEHQYRIIRTDGSVRWIRDSVQVTKELSGSGQSVWRLDGVITDITEAKKNHDPATRRDTTNSTIGKGVS